MNSKKCLFLFKEIQNSGRLNLEKKKYMSNLFKNIYGDGDMYSESTIESFK